MLDEFFRYSVTYRELVGRLSSEEGISEPHADTLSGFQVSVPK